MSEINNSNLPEKSTNGKKDITKTAKIIIGVGLGLLTVGGIMLSGAVDQANLLRTWDESIRTLMKYLWVVFFLIFMLGARSYETNRGYSMKAVRVSYLIVIAVFVVFMLIFNLAGGRITFAF